MTLGLIQYVAGRRHLAGRKHAAEFALAPDAMRRAVRLIIGGAVVVAVVATALALAGWLTMDRFVDVLTVISVIAPIVYFVVMFRSPGSPPRSAAGCARTSSSSSGPSSSTSSSSRRTRR